jgi:hypothetical protein
VVTEPSLSLSSASSPPASSSERTFVRDWRARRSLRVMAALAGAAVVLSVGILTAIDARRERPPSRPALSSVVDRRAPAATPAAPETVRLRVTVDPRSATITLDGAPVANAVAQRWPRSEQPQRLRVAHAGYAPIEQTLVLVSDQHVMIALAPQAPTTIPRALTPVRRPAADEIVAATPVGIPAQERLAPSPAASPDGANMAPTPAPPASEHSELLPMPL